MSQISLIPIEIETEEPADEGTADLKWIGITANRERYALKTLDDHPLLPLTEWMCYGICRAVGVLTPQYDVVRRQSGQLAFGSKWERSAWAFKVGKHSRLALIRCIEEGRRSISGNFMLDAFLPNPDRHGGNILFDESEEVLKAIWFDFSRVESFSSPFFQPWPWGSESGSARLIALLRAIGHFDADAADAAAQRLRAVPWQTIEGLFMAAPDSWRSSVSLPELRDWWDTQRHDRTTQARHLLDQ